jgi:hypothetical protein
MTLIHSFRNALLSSLVELLQINIVYCTNATQQPITDFRIFPVVNCIRDSYAINQFIVHLINEIYTRMSLRFFEKEILEN